MTFAQIRTLVHRTQCMGIKITALKFSADAFRQFCRTAQAVSYAPATGDLYWLGAPLKTLEGAPYKSEHRSLRF